MKEVTYLVKGVDDAGSDEEEPEPGRACEPGQAVDQTQEVEDHVEAVRRPEELVRLLPDDWVGEHEDDDHHDEEQHSCQTCRTKTKTREITTSLKIQNSLLNSSSSVMLKGVKE